MDIKKDKLLILLIRRTAYRIIASLIFIFLLISTFHDKKIIENKSIISVRIIYTILAIIFLLFSLKYFSLILKHKRIIK
jgi:hypothetical protein